MANKGNIKKILSHVNASTDVVTICVLKVYTYFENVPKKVINMFYYYSFQHINQIQLKCMLGD